MFRNKWFSGCVLLHDVQATLKDLDIEDRRQTYTESVIMMVDEFLNVRH